MRQLTASGGAIPAARFWTRRLSEYRGAPRLPRGAPSVGGRGAPRLRRGATSVCGSRRATASPGRDERCGSRRATASPRRDERWGSRRATASPGRDERWGVWGAISGPPMSLVEHHRIAGRAGGANDPQRRPDERALEDLLVDERLGVDVLQVPDAPAGLHLRVAGHREVGPLLPRGLRVARRRIAHGQRDVPRGQVLAGAEAEAGLPLVEEVAGRLALGGVHGFVPIIAPAVALPGVQRHAVPRRDVPKALHLEHASDVIRGDDARIAGLGGDRQHLGTRRDHALGLLVGDGVQHLNATHEAKLTRMLDAQGTYAYNPAARGALVA